MRKSYTLPISEECFLGRYTNTVANMPLDEHIHEGSVEICFLLSGTQTYRIGDDIYILKSGDYFITLPNQFHGTNGTPQERGELMWLILKLPKEGRFLELLKTESKQIISQLLSTKTPHFKGDHDSKKLWKELWKNTVIESDNVLIKMQLRLRLIECLMNFIECSTRKIIESSDVLIGRCCELIEKNPCAVYRLDELADNSHLSLSRFKTRFKQNTGIPPREFINRTKVEYAKKRIKENISFTEISMSLGFSSSQYFSIMFKKFTRMTPGEWRGLKK